MEMILHYSNYITIAILVVSIILLSRSWRKFQDFAITLGNKKIKEEAERYRYWTIGFMFFMSTFLVVILNHLISNLLHRAMTNFDTSVIIAIFLALLGILGKINFKSFIKNEKYDRYDIVAMQFSFLFIGFVIATFIVMRNDGITITDIINAHFKK